jgi:hypothetical protein
MSSGTRWFADNVVKPAGNFVSSLASTKLVSYETRSDGWVITESISLTERVITYQGEKSSEVARISNAADSVFGKNVAESVCLECVVVTNNSSLTEKEKDTIKSIIFANEGGTLCTCSCKYKYKWL